jgi:hypothetical protein
MTPYPWELRDPAAAVDGIARRHRLYPGVVVAALVELPSTTQQLLDTMVVYEGDDPPSDARVCALLAQEAARQLFEPRATIGPPRHSFVTIVARNGDLAFEPAEYSWLIGWQHADHRLPVYTGELILLTEQGWRAEHDHSNLTGFSPVLVAA